MNTNVKLSSNQHAILDLISSKANISNEFDNYELDEVYEFIISKNPDYSVTDLTELLIALKVNPLKYVTFVCERMYSDTDIEAIEIPDNITSIEYSAFYGCEKLFMVVITAKNIKSIDEDAFGECPKLDHIYYSGTTAQFKRIRLANEWIDHAVTIVCSNGSINYKA